MNKKLLLSIAFVVGPISNSQAELLYYESFDYPVGEGDLSTESGGVWNDSGTTIESGSLSYGDLSTAGNRVTKSDDSSWTSVDLGSGNLDDGDTVWFSVLINTLNGTNPDFGFALGTDRLNDSNNVPMSDSGTGLGFRVKNGILATSWSNTPSSAAGAGYTAGTTVLVVGEIIFGATDTVNIYLPGTDLTLGEVVSTQTASFTQTDFDTIALSDKAANPRDQVDEIRFGTTSADVLPTAAGPAVDPVITSITPVDPLGFELTIVASANTEYAVVSSEALDFENNGSTVLLTQGNIDDPGTIGLTGDTVTTDENGNATVRFVSVDSKDFVRVEPAVTVAN